MKSFANKYYSYFTLVHNNEKGISKSFLHLYQKGLTFFYRIGNVNAKIGQYRSCRIKLADSPWYNLAKE